MGDRPATHDSVVIGASAGGVEALQRLMRDLPADLPAAVFVVLHVGDTSYLPALLDRAGPLPAAPAMSGEPIERGHVYVAAPGRHLLLHDDHILLRRGPRENLARPAIDPLFRSAACSFGTRTIGVVLTGALNDGTAGLRAIKRCGGIAVVQDPNDAAVPDMPRNAQKHVDVDHCVPLAAMGKLLARLTATPAGGTPEIPMDIRLEAAIAAQELSSMSIEDTLGTPSRFTCPECHGALWEIADGDMRRYRCHTGHAFTADAMLAAQDVEGEQLLWLLMRSHHERAALARHMAEDERARNGALAAQLQQRARDHDDDAELIREIIRDSPSRPPPTGNSGEIV
jgi:two-component system, chemotaxis family, protein-glutamate methylesterase/glutaminase